MLIDLLKKGVAATISKQYDLQRITQVRLRVGSPIKVETATSRGILRMDCGLPLVSTKDDVDFALEVASGHSVYAVNDDLVKGFLHYEGGVRIGACGVGVAEKGELLTLKQINSILIRLPHEVKGCVDSLFNKLCEREMLYGAEAINTLVISPPACGKTTALRELARLFSKDKDLLIIDERFEIAGTVDGVPTLDVGCSDVVSGISKTIAYENTIRAMSPEIIVTDEVFRDEEIAALCDVVRSGVSVLASVHAKDLNELQKSPRFAPLLSAFRCFVVLGNNPVGHIVGLSFREA